MVVKLERVPFEDALDMTGFGKFNYWAFLLCNVILLGMTFEIMSVAYLVPASRCELNTTSAQQGIIAAIPLVGIILTSHFWGYLADTRGRRFILCVSMIMACTAGSLASLSPNWITLCTLKLFSSAAASSGTAVAMTLLSEVTPMNKRSTLIILTNSVFLFSGGVMAVISAPVLALKFSYPISHLNIEFNAWRLLDLIFALPTAFGAIGVFLSYESPKYLLSVGKIKEALEVLRGIFEMNSGKDADLYRVNSVVLDENSSEALNIGLWASIKAQTLPMFRKPLLKNTFVLTSLFISVYMCVNPLLVWLPYTVNAFMLSVEKGQTGLTLCEMIRFSQNSTSIHDDETCTMNQHAMVLVFAVNIIIGLTNLVTTSISRCIDRRTLFITLQILVSITAFTLNLGTMWVINAIGFLVYLLGGINFGALTSFCVDIYPTSIKAMAICMTLMFGRGSAILGINMMKRLIDTNCEACFYIYGAISLAGAIVGWFLPTEARILEDKEKTKREIMDRNNTENISTTSRL